MPLVRSPSVGNLVDIVDEPDEVAAGQQGTSGTDNNSVSTMVTRR